MIFLGYDFYYDEGALDFTPRSSKEITKVELNSAMVDELYATKNTAYDMSSIPDGWDYNTIMHALFENTLTAGNVNYTLSEITSLRLKRREAGTYDWITLADFPVKSIDDFLVTYIDRYVDAGIKAEYMLVAVIGNAEGSYNNNTVDSIFDGIVIAEKDKAYRAFIYDYVNTERNQITGIVNPLKGKYPFVIKNGDANYTSGSVHAAFLPINGCEINHDYLMSTKHREELTDFLTNGKPKVLKLDDGRSWIVNIVDNVSHTTDWPILYTDFNFVQTGNALLSQDLYYADLIDVNM